jgi:CPA2 family monovalent cation:H+ antiporter-2
MEPHLEKVLLSAAVLFAACAAVAALTLRLRQSVIVGYLLAGVLIGPHLLGLVGDERQVEEVGELGVVFLLFFLGTELSLERLRPLVRPALLGGSLQIALTIGAALGVAALSGWSRSRGAYFGCVIALSSTAIVVKLLAASDELRAPHGKFALGVLLFQDVAVVPMMIILPALAASGGAAGEVLRAAGKAAAFLALSYVAGRWLFPPLLAGAARKRSQELFTLTVLALALGMALVSNYFGLSLAMGAFVAGLTLGQSPFSQKILADVLPFRDAFLSLFFVSIGMLLDPGKARADLAAIGGVVFLIIGLKTMVSALVGRFLGLPPGMALQAGLVLSQVGEFSFVLARMGHREHHIDDDLYQVIISSSVATMALTPWLVKLGGKVSGWLAWAGPAGGTQPAGGGGTAPELRDHVVICGFGPVGRLVAAALRKRDIPFLVLELNPETIDRARREAVPVLYGDARSEVVLTSAGIDHARGLVVALPHVETAEGVVRNVRLRRPKMAIYARAVFIPHLKRLREAGATATVHDEREAGRAIVRALLSTSGESPAEVERLLERLDQTEEGSPPPPTS